MDAVGRIAMSPHMWRRLRMPNLSQKKEPHVGAIRRNVPHLTGRLQSETHARVRMSECLENKMKPARGVSDAITALR